MDIQNLGYTVVQIAHNFGAVAVVGSAFMALWLAPEQAIKRRQLAWLMLAGWAVQAASGSAFGALSWLYYGQLPDIHGIAIAALLIKISCAASGFVLVALYLYRDQTWAETNAKTIWRTLAALAATALTAAAFLRWFS